MGHRDNGTLGHWIARARMQGIMDWPKVHGIHGSGEVDGDDKVVVGNTKMANTLHFHLSLKRLFYLVSFYMKVMKVIIWVCKIL